MNIKYDDYFVNDKNEYCRICPICDKIIIHNFKHKRAGLANIRRAIKKKTPCKLCCDDLKRHVVRQNNSNWKGYGEISSSYFNNIKKGAIHRNILFEITIQDVNNQWIKQTGICNLSGQKIEFISQRNYTASLDRIDSSKGYTIDNIQWIHKDINRMKNKFNQQYFVEMCSKIHMYNKGEK